MFTVYTKQTPEAYKEAHNFNTLADAVKFAEFAINENDFVVIEDVGAYRYINEYEAVFELDPYATM